MFTVSVVLLGVLLLFNLLFILPSFNKLLIQDKKENAVSIARHLSSFIHLEKISPIRESLPTDLLGEVVRHKNDFGLIKLKIYSNSGETLYSTAAEDTGKINQKDYFQKVLRNGTVQVKYIKKNSKSLDGESFSLDVIETYIPLMRDDQFLGAVEIYYDITQRKEQLDHLISHSTDMLFGLAAGLFFIIIVVLIHESKEAAKRKKVEEALAWESSVDLALSQLYEPLISPEASVESITNNILDQAKTLTESPDGYVSSLDPHTSNVLGRTLSKVVRNLSGVLDGKKMITFPKEEGVYSDLRQQALKHGKSFYTSLPEKPLSGKGHTKGHIPLKRFLCVPIMLGEALIGQIVLANKMEDYVQRDLEAVRRLANFFALAIQRVWAEEALQEAHDSLERRVEERTRELLESNTRLMREIEEHKKTEEELSRAKTTLQSVVDGISDPLIMLNSHFSIVMLNEAARKYCQISDHDNGEFVDQVCYKALMGQPEPCEDCEVSQAIASGKRTRFERKGFMNPERFENVVVYPIMGESGKVEEAIIHIRDITKRKLFEKQLIQSEKLASLGILVSSIAHEINNPNSFISFNTPILKDYLGELMPIMDIYAEGRPDLELFHMPYPEFRKDLYKLLDNIEHGASRINSVVSNLREFSRGKDKKEEKWIDLESVIEKSLSMCENKLRKSIKSFVKDIPEDLPNIYSDPHGLEQILINLLLNAAQASDKKDSRVTLSVKIGNTWLDKTTIQVDDNGCGMDPDTLKHIFDPFFTSNARSGGTGLGLYVTHNLVSSLRGRIEVESEPGKGSTFKVILPDKERRKKKRE